MLSGDMVDRQREWRIDTTKDGRRISWSPVVTFSRESGLPPLSLGISSELDWVLNGGVGPIVVVEPSSEIVGAFPLLEIDPAQVLGRLEQHLAEKHFDISLADKFPFSQIVAAALLAPTRHWPDDGLRWASSLMPDEKLARALVSLASSGTQAQRHAATRILRAHKSAQEDRSQ